MKTNADFAREYAAAIDRMMAPRPRTWMTVDGKTHQGAWGDTKLDLPPEFFEARARCQA